jgi:pimeloyl-ACP methyl ester carboxylesterase
MLRDVPNIAINDMSLYYETEGEGDALFLMHGAGSASDDPVGSWSGLTGMFSAEFRTIAIDHRGHGRTDNPGNRFDYETLATDTVALADALGIERFHLAGVSDGAIVGLHLGMVAPQRVASLVLLGVNYTNDDNAQAANAAWQHIHEEPDDSPNATVMSQRHDRAGKAPGYWRSLMAGTVDNVAHYPSYEPNELSHVVAPALLLAGEHDGYANLDQLTTMKQQMANAELCILNNAGHTVQYSHPHLVGPIVLDFLRRHATHRGHEGPQASPTSP